MAGAEGRGLTEKQAAFVREYPIDMNGTQAAIRAGYSKNGARQQGSALLAIPAVQAAVRAALDEMSRNTVVTKAWLLEQAVSIQREARADKAHSAAVSAAKLAAQLSGNLIERRETRQVQDWSDLTDEELRALAAADHPGKALPSKTKH